MRRCASWVHPTPIGLISFPPAAPKNRDQGAIDGEGVNSPVPFAPASHFYVGDTTGFGSATGIVGTSKG